MSDPKHVKVGPISFGNDLPFVLISGPCQIESRDHALFMADALAKAAADAGVPFIFKSSFDKANRTSVSGKRGVGIDAGLAILAEVKAVLGCPVLTDIHGPEQVEAAAQAVDILQIPAFLCRQTDLLIAAGKTGAVINVKKGQFLAPWDMAAVAQKVASTGNERILLTERGASFGYNTLVSDMRALPVMAETGYPVVFDATHSVQQPGGLGSASGGQRDYAPLLARSAVAAGVAAIFAEAHEDPDNAPSDGPVMLKLDWVGPMLKQLKAIDRVVKG
ncbi:MULTISPECIES: 3-deoxy-8-phosphooctulonate synthase [Sphingobium]|jgi:2-dehydro-3-deoxyphosphooctonate aldolase (KDO 8-P synthase)|uniref:2-dehydro-3-deoxyphosphooctonate aldolase n=1 Tax=Sphingobium yanoikuyae TaxID=13690 RepID=A0A0J9D598_SPHYA|nr:MULTISPECIES: 3-deoxy-8-phosphooctulonate synthase [Sphingobium]ATP21363.1 3-deoxy-8-phosphooctulonate synthase [Sphingobium yanoikuyae]KMW32349.1 2-dehydro-3-deoxyphosphooctonate aldolase [Sphingobium yanoikuyae]TKV40528.1 3-deoxy-8-phosphooctulonate synthase [Sphingobium sp. MP9-4]